MKRYLIAISLLLSIVWTSRAQGVFSIQSVPVCWSTGSVDSSLVANWLISSNQAEPVNLSYLNAEGQAVTVVGGTLRNGYCCCEFTGVSNVSVTDNADGTYTVIVDTDTTLIDTRDTISQNIIIGGVTYNAGDFINNVVIQIGDYLQAIGAGEVCGDTLVQAGHGFSVGDLIGQTAGNGAYFQANTASADSLPVAAVRTVISVDTFVVCNEGFFSGFTHGKLIGRDYFLQDDGSLDTIPDTDYAVFAFRTFKTNKAYFDIPELVISGGGGGGGGGGTTFSVTASNGLNDADLTTDVDVELGGTLDKDTDIELDVNNFTMTRTGAGIKFQVDGASTTDGIRISPNPSLDSNRPQGAFLYKNTASGNPSSVQWTDYDLPITAPQTNNTNAFYVYDPFGASYWKSMLGTNSGITLRDSATLWFRAELNGPLTRDANIDMGGGLYHFQVTDGYPAAGLTDSVFVFKLNYDDDANPYFEFEFDKDVGGTQYRMDIRADTTEMYFRFVEGANATVFRITPYSVVIESPPAYTNDAAADADSNLPSGGVYTLTGDRTLYIKP